MSRTRVEKDSMGEVELPEHALYGAQTQRAINNFHISGQKIPFELIQAIAWIKLSAALANQGLKLLDKDVAVAIVKASRKIIDGQHYPEQFPVDIYQTGSGTSTNMNVNEVIATLANNELGNPVSPNDHVNLGQSSNDVIPTAIHVSTVIAVTQKLLPALEHLHIVISSKANKLVDHVKTGRTHLMDAMPVTLGQEFGGWAGQIQQQQQWIKQGSDALCYLAQGGTAVGTGINAHEKFSKHFVEQLSQQTGIQFYSAADKFTAISSQDVAVAFSGALKSLAVSLTKMANDLRWMNSGPLSGLAEIELEALQPGSSIMPGKVNPVIPEAVLMAMTRVMGNDLAITLGGQGGNFQLNTMLPIIGSSLLESVGLLTNSCLSLADKTIATLKINEDKLKQNLDSNPVLVTALNPHIGYMAAAEIAKQAYREKRPIIDVAEEKTDFNRQQLEEILDPLKLTRASKDHK